MWNLIQALRKLEDATFGRRYTDGKREIKGTKFLDTKAFKLARRFPPFDPETRKALSKRCLDHGSGATPDRLARCHRRKHTS